MKKLRHDNLQVDTMDSKHYDKAMELTKLIIDKAEQIYQALDTARYNLKKIGKNNRN